MQASGFNLGEVEHIIDQRQQVLPALRDGGHIFALAVIERASNFVAQPLTQAENGSQRRAQFVAHARQKLIADAQRARQFCIGHAQRFFAATQIVLNLLDRRDVRGHADKAGKFTGTVMQHCQADHSRKAAAILALQQPFRSARLLHRLLK